MKSSKLAVATDSSGNVYVAHGSVIQKFDSNGTHITEWGEAMGPEMGNSMKP